MALLDRQHRLAREVAPLDALVTGEPMVRRQDELQRLTKERCNGETRVIDGERGKDQIVLARRKPRFEIAGSAFAYVELERGIAAMEDRENLWQQVWTECRSDAEPVCAGRTARHGFGPVDQPLELFEHAPCVRQQFAADGGQNGSRARALEYSKAQRL
jgi:hypothetical protein